MGRTQRLAFVVGGLEAIAAHVGPLAAEIAQ
jgi:hypothetical protein